LIRCVSFLFLFAMAAPTTYGADLTQTQINKEIAWQVLNVIDYGQTRDIANKCHSGEIYEQNPALDSCPDRDDLPRYFLISGIAHYALTKYFTNYRDDWQNVSLIFTAGIVTNNYRLGVKIDF